MSEASVVAVGDILRVPYKGATAGDNELPSYLALTRGAHETPADVQKGIFYYKQVREPGQEFSRVPAFIFYSNPFKRGTEGTPWVDVVEPDEGYCLFHGDNRTPDAKSPIASRGNHRFVECLRFFADPALRRFAPPILLFDQVAFKRHRRGYRRFCGFGVPARLGLATHKEKGGAFFTNLVIELVLFRLDRENEVLHWNWIDQRRDRSVTSETALSAAPASWREWVDRGELAIEGCRRFVARQTIVRPLEQETDRTDERDILKGVLDFHQDKKHEFEGLASFVAQRVLGPKCTRGWVTRRSGDGGIDFVCRLDVGDPGDRLSRTTAVVLGQAKCVKPDQAIGGHDLARVVARLQRGWIGAFVTTGTFSRGAQLELAQDRYPVVLINGRRLARELLGVLTQERISLKELLNREYRWYLEHMTNLGPARILDDAFSFTALAISELVAGTAHD